MPGAFDPYHTWLGIPPAEQPPNHYRLLGLPRFEDQPEAIEQAADQRMVHLHALQTSKHADLARKLLSQVAAARLCLLNPQKKAAYDRQLRETVPTEAADADGPAQVAGEPARQKTVTYRPQAAHAKPGAPPTAESTALGHLGEYELLEKLGEGGMGAVYKARHTKLKRMVALKVLPKGRREDDRAIARFEREMEAIGRLDHPNIVRAHDAREVEGTRFLVMEYVEGLDLAKLVRRLGPLPVADACELTRQAALGLQSAHEHGLVHRDVKPSNLMLTARGEVKLLDLGLARFQSQQPAGEEMTRTGQAVGTLDYMAPEQISDTHSIDIRADIYALGCTLYKLLTGQAPFSGPEYENHFEKMEAHLRKPAAPMGQFRADAPMGLAAVVDRMLAKDPAGRFASPAEVADAIGSFATGSDLPALLVRAGHKPPVLRPDRSLEATAGVSASSGLTRFLRQLKIQPPPPPPGSEQPPRWPRPVIVAGLATVGVLLVAILIAWAVRSTSGTSAAAALVFDCAGSPPEETTLWVDGKRQRLPASGRLSVKCTPGTHRIEAVRKGFKPYEKTVQVKAGQRVEILPVWQPQFYLVLRWPVAERQGARVEIDGQLLDVSLPAIQKNAELIKVPLEPGTHRLRIPRRGFEPFEQPFAVVDGQDTQIEVRWIAAVPSEKSPVPSEEVQEEIARRIDQAHGVGEAKTAQKKLVLAAKLLELARQSGENADERFVLLRRAKELASEGGDAALVFLAVDALGAAFEVDLPAERQRAVSEFLRSVTPPAKVYSLIEADRFAQAATQSPKIASLVVASSQLAVADAYWELARTEQDASRSALILCAGHWYERAQSEAGSAAIKHKFTVRLKEIAQIRTAVQKAQAKLETERQYAQALRPAEAMVAAWDFRGAATALGKLAFAEPELAARLARRRDEVKRLAALKGKMIQKINAHKPPYRKSDLMIPGLPGDLAKADEAAIIANLDSGKSESLGWESLSGKTVERLLPLAVDPRSPDDHLAAGLLALVAKQTASAEQYFGQARTLGFEIGPYLAPLAAASFGEARRLLQDAQGLMEKAQFGGAKGKFAAADAALTKIEQKYAVIPWVASNRNVLDAARREATTGIGEAEAEELYAEATRLFEAKTLFDLREVLNRLKADYGETRPVKNIQRSPSFADLQKAVETLGEEIIVRQDGKPDKQGRRVFKAIQAAIDAAPPNSLIEIQDNGPYNEKVNIRGNREGLTLRGRKGCWAIITSVGSRSNFGTLVSVWAPQVSLERLILAHGAAGGEDPSCLSVGSKHCCVRSSVFCGAGPFYNNAPSELENCILFGSKYQHGPGHVVLRNSLWLGRPGYLARGSKFENALISSGFACPDEGELRLCTIGGHLRLGSGTVLTDCIVPSVESTGSNTRIEHCNVHGANPFVDLAKPGKGCFTAPPMFVNPKVYDYRLMPGSPCRGKASDGGDLGCRFTPEMIEMLKLALELRQRGLIKF